MSGMRARLEFIFYSKSQRGQTATIRVGVNSIQFEFTHTPAVGKTWIVNPRGDLKNVLWSDTGSGVRVILTPTAGATLSQMIDFKFYISGGISGITPTNLKAYDINGVPVSGVSFAIQ